MEFFRRENLIFVSFGFVARREKVKERFEEGNSI
jgi:hypothetical protein